MGFMAFRVLAMRVRGEQHMTDADVDKEHGIKSEWHS